MSLKRSGLGRNLSALLGPSATATPDPLSTETLKLAIHCLEPGKYQPRAAFDEASLQELVESIKKQGLLQPLLVRELSDGRYEIIAGERRWRASQLAGLTSVPVILKQVDDETALAMALVENLQREDLNAMDQARAMHRLTDEFALTHQQVADLLSKARTSISNYLRLLSLSDSVKKLLEHGDLEMGHARALLVLDDRQQLAAAELIIAKNLSVRDTEQLVKRIKLGKPERTMPLKENKLYLEQVNRLSHHLKTKVHLKTHASGKGTLVIHYEDMPALDQIITRLSKA